MAETQLVLKCPYCNIEAEPPDSWRSEFSFGEPAISKLRRKKKQEVACNRLLQHTAGFFSVTLESKQELW